MGAYVVAPESRCWLGKYHFSNVDRDVVVGRSLKKTAHQLDVLLVGCWKKYHVFDDPVAIWDVVKDFGDATAVVVSCVRDAERKAPILIPAKRSWKRCQGCRFFVQSHLVITFQGVDYCKKLNTWWNRSHCLERVWLCRISAGWCCGLRLRNPHKLWCRHLSSWPAPSDRPKL